MSSGPNTGRKPTLPEYQQAVGRVLRPGTRSSVTIDLTSVEARIVATTSPAGQDLYCARAAEIYSPKKKEA